MIANNEPSKIVLFDLAIDGYITMLLEYRASYHQLWALVSCVQYGAGDGGGCFLLYIKIVE